MSSYVVQQGDCLSSIAIRFGYNWATLWNDPSNADLRKRRKNPNVLFAGDVVVLPDKPKKSVSVSTEQLHRFTVTRPKAHLRLKMRDNGEPIANEKFELDLNGNTLQGSTDDDGKLDVEVPGCATTAKLRMPGRKAEWTLMIGHLDPVDEVTGAQARLKQLGFYAGEIDGAMGAFTVAALNSFQRKHRIAVTGALDDATKRALEQKFGC